MDQVEHLMTRADECLRMARSTRDREARAAWQSMADRWARCADVARRANGYAARFRLARRDQDRTGLH